MKNSNKEELFKTIIFTVIPFILVFLLYFLFRYIIEKGQYYAWGRGKDIICFISGDYAVIAPMIIGLILFIWIGSKIDDSKSKKVRIIIKMIIITLIGIFIISIFSAVALTKNEIIKYNFFNITGKKYKYSDVKEIELKKRSGKSGGYTLYYTLNMKYGEKIELRLEKENCEKIKIVDSIIDIEVMRKIDFNKNERCITIPKWIKWKFKN